MSEAGGEPLILTVGGQELRLRAAPGDRARFEAIAARLNEQLEAMRGGKLAGPRLLAMALFQQAVEMEELRAGLRGAGEGSERLSDLIRRIDQATAGETAE